MTSDATDTARWQKTHSARVALIGDDAQDLLAAAGQLRVSGFTLRMAALSRAMSLPKSERRQMQEVDVVVVRDPATLDGLIRLVKSARGGLPYSRMWTIVQARHLSSFERRRLLKAGSDYVLAMPAEGATLPRLVQAALTAAATSESVQDFIRAHRSAVGSMVSGVFEFRTLEEAERIAGMLAVNYSSPDKVAVGLWELLSNAVEHGNLEISYDHKTKLLQSGEFLPEVQRRLLLRPYGSRVARVEFERLRECIRLRVSDEGPGFDFEHFLNADLPADRPNGRGISIARKMCLGRLTYQGRGNVVEVVTPLSRPARRLPRRARASQPLAG